MGDYRRSIARIDAGRVRGTAFLIAPDLVLTAYHVVAPREAATLVPHGPIKLTFEHAELAGPIGAAPIPGAHDALADWIVLRLAASLAGKIEPLPLGELHGDEVDETEVRFKTFGYPEDAPKPDALDGSAPHLDPMDLSGVVVATNNLLQGSRALQLNASEAGAGVGLKLRGLSGAPVMVRGAAIGVMRWSPMDDAMRTKGGTLFAVPLAAVRARAEALLPPVDPCWGLAGLPDADLPDEPFLDLLPYNLAYAAVFFGRCREIRSLLERIESDGAGPLILYYGQSGVGKSSILEAGVLPRLHATHEVRSAPRDPVAGLAGTLRRLLGGGDDVLGAWKAIEQASGRPLVVVLDQSEAYARAPGGAAELEAFAALVRAVLGDRETRPRGRLIVAFRKEWLPELETALRGVPREKVFLRPLDRAGVIEVIAGVVATPKYRLRLDPPDLARRIADDLTQDPGSPIAPLLQVRLTQLYRASAAASPVWTLAAYERAKTERRDLRMYLERKLEAVAAELPLAARRGLVIDVLHAHVDADGPAARACTRAELEAAYPHVDARAVVDALVTHHLLVEHTGEGADPTQATRLVHDTLAPEVEWAFARSRAPGPRARRLLELRAQEHAADPSSALPWSDLRVVTRGRLGMRAPTAAEAQLMVRARRNERVTAAVVIGALLLAIGGSLWPSEPEVDQVLVKRAQALQAKRCMARAEAEMAGGDTDKALAYAVTAAVGAAENDPDRPYYLAVMQVIEAGRAPPSALIGKERVRATLVRDVPGDRSVPWASLDLEAACVWFTDADGVVEKRSLDGALLDRWPAGSVVVKPPPALIQRLGETATVTQRREITTCRNGTTFTQSHQRTVVRGPGPGAVPVELTSAESRANVMHWLCTFTQFSRDRSVPEYPRLVVGGPPQAEVLPVGHRLMVRVETAGRKADITEFVEAISILAMSADGRWVATSNPHGTFAIHWTATGVQTLKWTAGSMALDAAFDARGETLTVVYADGAIETHYVYAEPHAQPPGLPWPIALAMVTSGYTSTNGEDCAIVPSDAFDPARASLAGTSTLPWAAEQPRLLAQVLADVRAAAAAGDLGARFVLAGRSAMSRQESPDPAR